MTAASLIERHGEIKLAPALQPQVIGMDSGTDSTRIVFIADDFGMSPEINAAIVRAHNEGALHGACLMMGQPGTADAIDLARRHPTLQIGWHLHLNDSLPMTVERWPWGRSPARAGMSMAISPGARALARREIDAQWTAFRETGLACRFVNAHHHLHWHPFVRRRLVETVAADTDFDGWLRWGAPRFFGDDGTGYAMIERLLQAPVRNRLGVRHSDTLWGLDRTFAMNAEEIASVLPGLGPGLHEFMFHPRPGDGDADTRSLIALHERFPEIRPAQRSY
ncbi:MAG: ChbG/HpnK family deacetylase [Gammaproteobacteria bacterium]|nr:ChbG/HpnK family deacetylase [Gammaproteobacteria bacterium]MBT8444549.1 ChbG/HpnK family deacetylase [Gammaproteobacteria bacterium]NND36012.1 ChbG/HpnK family deacetylase [Gammaproteobacteria bacterium]